MVVLDESGYWSDMIFDISSAYTGSSYSVYWRDRAIAVGNAVGRAMVELRDRYGLPFDVGALHEAMSLDRISAFVDLGGLPEKPISENTVADLRAYLSALPQYRFGVPVGQQSLTCLEQHGYLAMQLARVMFERPMDTPIPLGTTPKFV
ncbi:MAG: hypothetical protein ING19_08590 [Azospirillum sp.]|nr:hypothetical protein [Azospirillum sp.]